MDYLVSGRDSARRLFTLVTLLLFSSILQSQTSRQINRQNQSWFALVSSTPVSEKISVLFDAQTRRTDFLEKSNFVLLRTALQYHIDKDFSVAAGYGHMWVYPAHEGWKTVSNEHRIYQQALLHSQFRKIKILHCFRNEQRWQQKISADKLTGEYRFTNRFRYLLGLNIPVFKDKRLPTIVTSDEILLQAGKEVVSNPFDQNWFFAGIRQRITGTFSFDTGYMLVYQQKSSGTQYDLNNTFRLFLYYTPHLKKT